MNRKAKAAIAAGALAIATGATTGVAVATGDDAGPIMGDALKRASDAALEFTGGGRVTDTEVGDEESYYEVEVTMPDGQEIDVQLDRDFKVVGGEEDEESGADDD